MVTPATLPKDFIMFSLYDISLYIAAKVVFD